MSDLATVLRERHDYWLRRMDGWNEDNRDRWPEPSDIADIVCDDILRRIPAGAVIVTEDMLARALEKLGACCGSHVHHSPAVLLAAIREQDDE